jgi:RNA polymerase sigma-70 factor (ECF subfamily)
MCDGLRNEPFCLEAGTFNAMGRPARNPPALRVVERVPSQPPSDAELVVAARAGEDWAREALCRRHAPAVLGLSHRLLGRDDETDDLAQEAFAQALASLDRLEDPAAFGGWIRAIVVRTAHKLIRRRVLMRRFGLGPRRADPLDEADFISPEAPPDVRAELRAVYALLEKLPARERIALVLHRVEGFSHEQIAAHLGVSLSTAKRLAVSSDAAITRALEDPR